MAVFLNRTGDERRLCHEQEATFDEENNNDVDAVLTQFESSSLPVWQTQPESIAVSDSLFRQQHRLLPLRRPCRSVETSGKERTYSRSSSCFQSHTCYDINLYLQVCCIHQLIALVYCSTNPCSQQLVELKAEEGELDDIVADKVEEYGDILVDKVDKEEVVTSPASRLSHPFPRGYLVTFRSDDKACTILWLLWFGPLGFGFYNYPE
ncbi:hypothetical protein ACFE04_028039 [Oxalis oulophora]